MKKFDLTNTVVKGTEWFASLALLNLCWLLFSFPIFTIVPATDTVFELLNEWDVEGLSPSINVFQQFKETFKQNFKKSYKWGLPLFVVLLILVFDLYFLNQLTISTAWFQVFKYAFYTFAFLLVLAILYGVPMMKRTGEHHIRVFVFALMMAVTHPLVTLAVIASSIALVFIFLTWPSMLFFFALTGIAWIMTKAVSYIFSKEEKKRENNIE